jgi:hypothetical protein
LKFISQLTAVFPTRTAVAAISSITTSTAAPSITTAPTATGAGSTFFPWTSLVNRQRSSVHFLAVQSLDRCFCALAGFHGNETKASRATTKFIHQQIDVGYRTVLGKKILEFVLSCTIREIPDVKSCTHVMTFRCRPTVSFQTLFPTAGFQIITENTSQLRIHQALKID